MYMDDSAESWQKTTIITHSKYAAISAKRKRQRQRRNLRVVSDMMIPPHNRVGLKG